MKRIIFLIILFCIFCAETASCNEIPVIAVEPMLDRIGWYMSHKAYTFQTRLSAELFTNWKCHISARSIGLLLHRERSLSSLEKQLAAMPSPQWIVGGSYQKGRRINNKWNETDIELLLINANDGVLQRDVFREKAGHYNEIKFISEKIAQKLKLSPREFSATVSTNRKNETWAILPFFKILSIKDFENATKFSGSDFFVYQLQQSGKLKNIVSRENMQKLLAEHKLHLINNIDIGSAASIGRLLSADRIVYGNVTNGPQKGCFRLDILVVDCNSGVVVNAFTGTFTDDTMEEKLAKAAAKVLNTPDLLPPEASARSSDNANDIESRRLFDTIKKSRFQYRSTSVLSGQILSLAESYYLLNAKYPYRCLALAHELILNLYYQKCPEHWYYIYTTKAMPNGPGKLTTTEVQSRMAANFLLPVLDRLRNISLAEYNDSVGRLKFRLLVNAGRCDEAETIWRKRLDNGLDITDWDMGTLEMRRKNFRKGGDYFMKAERPGHALYAYYLSGDHNLAYRTGKEVKPLFLARYSEEFLIWIELLEKYGATGEALEWLEKFEAYGNHNSAYYKRRFFNIGLNKVCADTIKRLRASKNAIRFYPAREIFAPLTEFPVYYQGLGSMPQKELVAAADILKKELGLDVKIMQNRPMPVKGAYDVGHHAFSAEKLARAVRYAYGENYPSKGILLYILTNEAINDDSINVLFGTMPDFGIASFSRMAISAMEIDVIKVIAVSTARHILNNTMRENKYCNNYPCMMAAIWSFDRCKEFDFKICSDCIPYIKKGNIKRALRRMGNRNYVNHCSHEEIRNYEEYKKGWK
ncbi:MAG: hypothetical protein IJZ19_02545 [Lentisphaeria bacterium]|nr:hypothetical protein [Lentisphaeria bacterium]